MHRHNLSLTSLVLDTDTSFNEWLQTTEKDNICTFLRRTPHVGLFGNVSYYYCSRSGSSESASSTCERKHHLKVQGYTLINRTCPAHTVKW